MPEEDENVCPKSEGSTKDEQDMKTSEKITTLDDGPISSRTRSHVTVPGLECRQIGRRNRLVSNKDDGMDGWK
uniref:Bm9190, isoform a n=1 Tax=Brugia malayi TaxID=6279 RepID=A0A1I9G0W2_BRUMA|nr:Bm9190, isoform a [Brugia malayi]